MDLSYTPPLSSPWDPVQMAAQARVTEARTAPRSNDTLTEKAAATP